MSLNGEAKNLYFHCPRKIKLLVRSYDDIITNPDLQKGDQVKVTLELAREEIVDWKTQRQEILTACDEMGLEVFGIDLKINTNTTTRQEPLKATAKSRQEILAAFCKAENLPSAIKEMGLEFLKE